METERFKLESDSRFDFGLKLGAAAACCQLVVNGLEIFSVREASGTDRYAKAKAVGQVS